MPSSFESAIARDHEDIEDSRLSLNNIHSFSSSVESGNDCHSEHGLELNSRRRARPVFSSIYSLIPSLSIAPLTLFGWPESTPHRSSATSWLDGLRGVAALQVFFFHFFGRYAKWGHSWGSTPEDHYIHQLIFFRPIWTGGSAAVSTFFVISGYAITVKSLNLIRQKNYEGIFKGLCSSFFRRGFRLYLPILLLAIPTLILISVVDMSDGFIYPTEKADTFGGQIVHFLNATDDHLNPFVYKDNYLVNNRYTYVPTSWTIPMEYWGSLVCYLMVLGISRIEIFATRCFIMGFMALYSLHRGSWWSSNFLVGMILADWTIEKNSNKKTNALSEKPSIGYQILHDAIFVVLLCFGTYLAGVPPKTLNFEFDPPPRVGYEWLYKIYPPFLMFRFDEDVRWYWYWCGNLTVVSISQVSWLRAIFCTKFCQWLGKLSFSLYLVHALILSALSKPLQGLIEQWTGNKGLLCLFQFVVQTPLIFMLSAAVERWIDQPSIGFARWIEGKAFQPKREVGVVEMTEREVRDGHEMEALMQSS